MENAPEESTEEKEVELQLSIETPQKFARNTSTNKTDAFHTQVLLNLACSLEGADASLFPASFRVLEVDLGLSPSNLGAISFTQAFAAAASSPFWGYLSDKFLRKESLLVYGCTLWGTLAILMSFCRDFIGMLIFRCINGVALACINPISQTMLADIVAAKDYGVAFGIIQVSITCGTLLGSFLCASLSEVIIFGIKGWRYVFGFTGVICLLFALLLYIHFNRKRAAEESVKPSLVESEFAFVKDSDSEQDSEQNEPSSPTTVSPVQTCRIRNSASSDWTKDVRRINVANPPPPASKPTVFSCLHEMFDVIKKCLKIPTFVVIALQGIFGCCPWNSLSFLILYFQYCGLSNSAAALVSSCMTLGSIPGHLMGGYIGDKLNLWSQNHGRPLTAQISVILGLPLIACVFLVLPKTSVAAISSTHALLLLLFGMVSSWCSAGVNRPVLLEVMDPKHKGQILALLVTIEGAAAAIFGAPLTALLAEKFFGYELQQVAVSEMTIEQRILNRDALGNALTVAVVFPFTLCFICYGLLHFTLKKDRKAAGLNALNYIVINAEELQPIPAEHKNNKFVDENE